MSVPNCLAVFSRALSREVVLAAEAFGDTCPRSRATIAEAPGTAIAAVAVTATQAATILVVRTGELLPMDRGWLPPRLPRPKVWTGSWTSFLDKPTLSALCLQK